MVVSPTYFGACADVAALAEVAHERGVPLVVDEAWGAHLPFHPELPDRRARGGADLVTSWTHKIVGSLTQAAMLHLGHGGRIDDAIVDRCVSLVETTSPSACSPARSTRPGARRSSTASELLDETLAGARRTREAIARSRARRPRRAHGRAGRGSPAGTRCGWRSTSAAPAHRLRAGKIAFERATRSTWSSSAENMVVAMFGIGEPAAPPASASSRRCATQSSGSARASAQAPTSPGPPPPWGELAMTPREAFLGPQEVVPFDPAAGASATGRSARTSRRRMTT